MKRIYLIDCPGVVPPNPNDTPEDILFRGVVRVEKVESPQQYIPGVIKRVQTRHLERTYDIKFADATDFLSKLARKSGRLLRGGEEDLDGTAKMVLNDLIRGKIPFFTPPPHGTDTGHDAIMNRDGRLGEMPRKRKRDKEASRTAETQNATEIADGDSFSSDSNPFEGFDVDEDDDYNDLNGGIDVDDLEPEGSESGIE
jgi:nuclear GTP-binding protein